MQGSTLLQNVLYKQVTTYIINLIALQHRIKRPVLGSHQKKIIFFHSIYPLSFLNFIMFRSNVQLEKATGSHIRFGFGLGKATLPSSLAYTVALVADR